MKYLYLSDSVAFSSWLLADEKGNIARKIQNDQT